MRRIVMATYEGGVLKPSEELPLADQQRVVLVVVSVPERSDQVDPERLKAMETAAADWLAVQSPEAVRVPAGAHARQARRSAAAFDAALGEVRTRARDVDPARIAADVAAAVSEARALPSEVVAHLDAEVEAALKEWAAAGG